MADPVAFGHKAVTSIKVEATWNTDPTTPTKVPVVSNGVGQVESERQSLHVMAGEADAYQTSQGTELWQGDVVIPFDTTSLPTWLDILFGTETPPAPWESLVRQGSFTMYRDYGAGINRKDVFTGCQITKLGLDWAPGSAPLSLTLGVVSAKNTPATSSTPTTVSYDKPLHWSELALSWGGSSYAKCTKLSLDCAFNVQTGKELCTIGGAGQRAAFPIGETEIKGEITALFDGADLETWAGVERAILLTLTGVAGQGVWTLNMAKTRSGKPRYAVQGPQGVLATVPFTAYKTAAAAAALAIIYTAPV